MPKPHHTMPGIEPEPRSSPSCTFPCKQCNLRSHLNISILCKSMCHRSPDAACLQYTLTLACFCSLLPAGLFLVRGFLADRFRRPYRSSSSLDVGHEHCAPSAAVLGDSAPRRSARAGRRAWVGTDDCASSSPAVWCWARPEVIHSTIPRSIMNDVGSRD